MMTVAATSRSASTVIWVAAALFSAACSSARSGGDDPAQPDHCAARLATFDTLDYEAFSNQQWDRFSESHAENIVVTWPDGRETTGLGQHIADLKAMFVYAPNTSIKEHPIRICQGDYTAVVGIMTGTFSQPMPTPGGDSIAPTGKSFRLMMTTVGRWEGSTMAHEWLFWDNHAFMQQIGLSQ